MAFWLKDPHQNDSSKPHPWGISENSKAQGIEVTSSQQTQAFPLFGEASAGQLVP